MVRTIILDNGSKDQAYKVFGEVKESITDFKKESVSISAKDFKNQKDGWRVVRIVF